MREEVTIALARLLGYLRTWQNPDGLLGGTIATWWSSTFETAVPHPMNQFPVVLGLLELHRAGIGGGQWLEEARRVGDGLVASIEPNGLFRNAWGDIPGKPSGPIMHTPGITAFSRLFLASGDSAYLKTALHLNDIVRSRWTRGGPHLYHRVANQQCRWAQALLGLFDATRDVAFLDEARHLIDEALDHQVTDGPYTGAICQGRYDDRLISVYVAKCLRPILDLYERLSEPRYLKAATRLGDYLSRAIISEGIWFNYALPRRRRSRIWAASRSIDYRLRATLPFHHWRRAQATDWDVAQYPSFVARSGDGIAALLRLGALSTNTNFQSVAANLTRRVISYQLDHGGIRNTIGYSGIADMVMPQDVICPTRWNAYAFQALCEWACYLGVERVDNVAATQVFSRLVGEDGSILLTESADAVTLERAGSTVVRLLKPSGRADIALPEWRGEVTGPRSAMA